MNQRSCVSLFLIAFFATAFSACAILRSGGRSDITVHSVHSMNFGGTSTIVGVVADSAGQFLAGASVALFDLDTESLKIEAEVQPDGTYKIADIFPNKYRIRAKAVGFKTVEVNDLNLHTNTLVIIDFHLNKNK
jgi:hypothetical protein